MLFIGVLFFFSCQERGSEKVEKNKTDELKEIVVKIVLKTDTEDVFKIMLNNIEVDEFQKKNIIVKETIPVTSDYDNMTASFGFNNFSHNIIINLGEKLKKVSFNSIEISYGKNKLTINNENYKHYLKANKFVDIDNNSFKIVTKRIDGKHNPVLIAKKNIFNNLIKGKNI